MKNRLMIAFSIMAGLMFAINTVADDSEASTPSDMCGQGAPDDGDGEISGMCVSGKGSGTAYCPIPRFR